MYLIISAQFRSITFLQLNLKCMNLLILLSNLLLIISWILPNHYSPWAAAYHDFVAFSAIVLFTSTLLLIRENLQFPCVFLFAVAIACIPLLQNATGTIHYSGDGLINFIYLLGFAAALTTGYNLKNFGKLHSILTFWLADALLALRI